MMQGVQDRGVALCILPPTETEHMPRYHNVENIRKQYAVKPKAAICRNCVRSSNQPV